MNQHSGSAAFAFVKLIDSNLKNSATLDGEWMLVEATKHMLPFPGDCSLHRLKRHLAFYEEFGSSQLVAGRNQREAILRRNSCISSIQEALYATHRWRNKPVRTTHWGANFPF